MQGYILLYKRRTTKSHEPIESRFLKRYFPPAFHNGSSKEHVDVYLNLLFRCPRIMSKVILITIKVLYA